MWRLAVANGPNIFQMLLVEFVVDILYKLHSKSTTNRTDGVTNCPFVADTAIQVETVTTEDCFTMIQHTGHVTDVGYSL